MPYVALIETKRITVQSYVSVSVDSATFGVWRSYTVNLLQGTGPIGSISNQTPYLDDNYERVLQLIVCFQ